MTKNTFFSVSSVVFLIIGVVHSLRAFNGWEVNIAGFVMPVWASYIALIVAFYLSYQAFQLKKQS